MKILLINDSKVTRYALRIELKKLGVEVATADCAETALEKLKSRVPDAILMDHIMPGLNGLEALEIIRVDPRTAHVPIVLCTAQEDAEFAVAAMKKGVLAILPKSLAAERLPDIVKRIRLAIEAIASGNRADSLPASEPDPDSGLHAAAPTPCNAPSADELIALIDERLEAGINKRLTALTEALRRDLTEMLIAEAGHLVEMRLADERAVLAEAQPPVSLLDLGGLEARLIGEVLPDLIDQRIGAALEKLRPELIEDMRRSLPELSPLTGGDSAQPASGYPANAPAPDRPGQSEATQDVAQVADGLRDLARMAIQNLHAAVNRRKR